METLSNLTQLNKVPLDMTLEGLAAVQQGRRADDIGLQELMRKQAYETQMDPLRVAHQQLVNKGLTLGNDEAGFRLASLGRKDKMETELWDQTKATQLQKLLASEGEDKAKVFAQGIYQQLRSTKPGTPQHRALMGALATTQEWVEKARDHQAALQKQSALFDQQTKLEEMRQTGRLAVAQLRQDSAKQMAALKDPKDYQAYAVQLDRRAQEEQNPEVKAELLQQSMYARLMAERLNPAAAKPVLDTTKVGDGKLTTPGAAPMPQPPGAKWDADKLKRYDEWKKKQQGQ